MPEKPDGFGNIIYGVYGNDGSMNGLSPTVVRLGRFIMDRLAEDKSTADGLQFACRLPDKKPDFFACGGPAAEAYWQHFPPRRAGDQAGATRRLVTGLLETAHG